MRYCHLSAVNAVALTPDGEHIISGSSDETIKVWERESGKLLHSLSGHMSSIWSVALTPDGQQIVSGLSDNIIVWDLGSGDNYTLFWNNCGINSLAISSNSRWVACGDEQSRVWIFEWMK